MSQEFSGEKVCVHITLPVEIMNEIKKEGVNIAPLITSLLVKRYWEKVTDSSKMEIGDEPSISSKIEIGDKQQSISAKMEMGDKQSISSKKDLVFLPLQSQSKERVPNINNEAVAPRVSETATLPQKSLDLNALSKYKTFLGHVVTPDGVIYGKCGKERKASVGLDGRLRVTIYDNKHLSTYSVAKIVAELYVPNPDPERYTQVAHKNGVKTDNRAENLEWIASDQRDCMKKFMREVVKCDANGNILESYISITTAAKCNGLLVSSLCATVARGGKDKYGNYWRYKDDENLNV